VMCRSVCFFFGCTDYRLTDYRLPHPPPSFPLPTTGDNVEEIREATRLLEAAQTAATAAQEREGEARKAAAEAKQKEIAAQAAKEELEAALADLKAQEDAYNLKTETLTKKSEEGGVVTRNRAKNELAQHLAEDPLPLRRAKITMEAAVKKADRTRAAAAAARQASEEAAAAAETATQDALAKVAEAEAYLEDMKKKPGSAEGQMWWLERRIIEAKKYMPTSKGGIAK
jgi:F actin bundling C terminal